MGKKYALAVSCGRRLGRDLFSKTTKNNGIRSLHVSVSRKSLRGCSCPVIAVDFDSLKPVIHTTASARTLFFQSAVYSPSIGQTRCENQCSCNLKKVRKCFNASFRTRARWFTTPQSLSMSFQVIFISLTYPCNIWCITHILIVSCCRGKNILDRMGTSR